MKKILILGMLWMMLALPVSANSVAVPDAPDQAQELMPQDQDDFGQGVLSILKEALEQVAPNFTSSGKLCAGVFATCLVLSVIRSFQGKSKAAADLVGVLAVAVLLVGSTHSMITQGTETVTQISQYGKLLLPAMTAALAAQGGGITAAALYTATALFDAVLCALISGVLIPAVYGFLVLSILSAISQDSIFQRLKDLCKWAMSWFLKILLYVFTGYMAITGVVSGSADQTALKATKLTISSMVPVVGGILSDASETVLVGAGVMKNAAGIYGMLAIIALAVIPFLTIGAHYLLLKLTAALSGVFAPKPLAGLLEDFSACMGLVLGMVGAECVIQLISVVCFMKGMS